MSLLCHNDRWFMDGVALTAVAAEFGTPCYLYSATSLQQHYQEYAQALASYPHLICYAVKANANLSLLQYLAQLGCGFDIVSAGELSRVLAVGGAAQHVVFSGVGKSDADLQAALNAGIYCFNVESAAELQRLNQLAAASAKIAPISFRVNPEVDANTHPYIATALNHSKFGIAYAEAIALYQQAAALPHIQVIGLACHIGSQLTTLAPFVEALDKLLSLAVQLEALGIKLQHLDMGGGLGVPYHDESPPTINAYVNTLLTKLKPYPYRLILAPGRSLVAQSGVLLTRVEYLKSTPHKQFAIVDAGMNDLLRPTLYGAWHNIIAVTPRSTAAIAYDIVGPVCESSDCFASARPLAIDAGDLLAVLDVGAYGMSMSSNYNTRPRAAEVLIDTQGQARLIKSRETLEGLLADEKAHLTSPL